MKKTLVTMLGENRQGVQQLQSESPSKSSRKPPGFGFSTTTPEKRHENQNSNTPSKIPTPEKRRPLTPIQKTKGARENNLFGRPKCKSADEASNSPKDKLFKASQSQSHYSVQRGFIAKRNLNLSLAEVGVQTDNIECHCIVTSGEPTLQYWKVLAEERGAALEEVLKENQTLTEEVEAHSSANALLMEMLADAKKLCERINELPDDPDESGIVNDVEVEDDDDADTTGSTATEIK